jgi:pimeloyl-ACP methyl ester carboxylesterase
MGGKQFWTDEFFFHQWRIQRNALSDHCRLLDANDVRHAWGSFEECRAVLAQIQRERQIPPMQGRAVIVVHGLGDNRSSMNAICRYLEEKGGCRTFNVSYASTRKGLADHAKSLAKIVDNLPGIESIDFVGHSMGNLVIRHYLADREAPPRGVRPDPRFGRMVMLGPPNHGSELAAGLGKKRMFRIVVGKPGQELGPEWNWTEGALATPCFEFGILAGGRGTENGYNPWLPGDDDGIVSVASTRLAGATDFLLLPLNHAQLRSDDQALECTLRFLQHGYFVAPERRQPIREAKLLSTR